MSATTESDNTEIVPSNNSLIKVKVGSREYPMIRSTRCGVCMHPARFQIEEKLLLNFSYPSIVKFVSEHEVRGDDGQMETWPILTLTQIRHHRTAGHVGADAQAIEELSRRRAEQLGFDFENSTGQLIDHHIVEKMIVQQGMEKLVRGEMEIQAKDLQAAVKFFSDLEAVSQQNADVEQYQELIITFWNVVRATVSEEDFKKIMAQIATNPIVQQFQQKRKEIERKQRDD